MSLQALTGQLTGAIAIGTFAAAKDGGPLIPAILEALANPSLNFVPLYCDTYYVEREADISTSMLMVQSTGEKEFVTDNIAPHPRSWTMSGYLRSLIPYLENMIYFKPTIYLQKLILDQTLLSRKTAPFKTKDGEIVEVLIKSLKMEDTPTSQNSVKITLTVQELPYLEAIEGSLNDLADSAKSSLPVDAIVTSFSAAVVSTVLINMIGATL